MKSKAKEAYRWAMQKAYDMRDENKDIPHLVELCIFFGIEREELAKELKILLNLDEQKAG